MSTYTWEYLTLTGAGPIIFSNTTGIPPSVNVDQNTLTLITAPDIVSQQVEFTTAPVMSSIQSFSGNILTLPTSNTTLVGNNTTDVLSNKSLIDASTSIIDSSNNTIRLAFNVTGSASTTLTLATSQTANRTLTLPDANDVLVGRATTDTLTNKTLTNPVISAIINSGATLTLPTTNDTLVGRATTDTLTNKTWNGNVIGIAYGGSGQTTQTAAFDALAPTTTKGDIIVHNGTDNVRVGVPATNGLVLTTNSSLATGVTWGYPNLFNATVFSNSPTSINSTTAVLIPSMSYSIPAGQGGTYLAIFSTTVYAITSSSTITYNFGIYLNGNLVQSSSRQYMRQNTIGTHVYYVGITCNAIMTCTVGTAVNVRGFSTSGGNINITSRSLDLVRIG